MHEQYGEPNDEHGKHLCCEKCRYCETCGDCDKFGCGAKKVEKSKRGWGRSYGFGSEKK